MNLNEIEAQGFILALFIRDDGERFLLGTGAYQFLDSQLHFTANSFANDVVEVQGNDGVFFAGQVRRANTQAFDGYIGDADVPREDIENYRRQFIAFFRKNYYYTVVYVFNNGSAIKRQKGFIVDAPEVKELYQIYPQYHIALNFEDVNYYQYNENDEGIEQFGKSAIITLAEDSNTGGLIWQQGSAEPIIYGNTEQNQYSGKNLFNPNSSASTSSKYAVPSALPTGIRMTTSSAVAQGAYVWSLFIIGNTADYVGKTLTLSTLMSASSTNAPSAGIGLCNSDGSDSTVLVSTSDSPGVVSKTFTQADADNKPKIFLVFYATSGAAAAANSYVDYTNLQLEIGSTATSYEPYVGGIPAPNPDYPQAINNITGDIVLGVGKNLLGLEDGTSTNLGVGWSISNNTATVSGTPTTHYSYSGTGRTNFWKPLPKGNYTFSIGESINYRVILSVVDTNNTEHQYNIPIGDTKISFTTNYIMKDFRVGIRDLTANTFMSATITNLQLEVGSSASDFEPYTGHLIQLGSTELCKIGTYQDYIYRDENEDWYVHKEISEITIDGSLGNWARASANRFNIDNLLTGYKKEDQSVLMVCSHYVGYPQTAYNSAFDTLVADVPYGMNMTTGTIYNTIRIKDTRYDDANDFKTWVTSNPISLYYVLATSTDTKITDNTLITQLNDWASSLTTTGGVEWDNIGAVWEIGGSGGPVNVTIDSIDNVYPIWEVTGPATNPEIEIIETNTSIKYIGSIGADEKLVVDMLNKTALVNGVSMIGNISGVWCYLKPGNNKVTYVTDNAGAMPSKLLWQEVVG